MHTLVGCRVGGLDRSLCEDEDIRLHTYRRAWEAPGSLLHLLVRLSSLSENQDRARVAPV